MTYIEKDSTQRSPIPSKGLWSSGFRDCSKTNRHDWSHCNIIWTFSCLLQLTHIGLHDKRQQFTTKTKRKKHCCTWLFDKGTSVYPISYGSSNFNRYYHMIHIMCFILLKNGTDNGRSVRILVSHPSSFLLRSLLQWVNGNWQHLSYQQTQEPPFDDERSLAPATIRLIIILK